MDLYATTLKASGIALPEDRVIDGRDIMPLLTSDAQSPHEALLSMRGGELITVRSGKWKLHIHGTGRERFREDDWIDPRAPDGVTIIAPYEQARPGEYPGLKTGAESDQPALFDLQIDPGEQHDVAEAHPDVVADMLEHYRELKRQQDTVE